MWEQGISWNMEMHPGKITVTMVCMSGAFLFMMKICTCSHVRARLYVAGEFYIRNKTARCVFALMPSLASPRWTRVSLWRNERHMHCANVYPGVCVVHIWMIKRHLPKHSFTARKSTVCTSYRVWLRGRPLVKIPKLGEKVIWWK